MINLHDYSSLTRSASDSNAAGSRWQKEGRNASANEMMEEQFIYFPTTDRLPS